MTDAIGQRRDLAAADRGRARGAGRRPPQASARWPRGDSDRESAVIAAVELALVRLTEDFDLPERDGAAVRQGLDIACESTWSRGNACLT